METGDKAKDFTLPDQDGKKHSLSDYKGKWVLLYFYPKDNTPGCTKEACAIRDAFPDFKKHNAVVLGVSADSTESHKRFSEKHELPFMLLSDPDKKVIKAYGAWREKLTFGKKYFGIKRMSFLIDPQQKIAKVYKTVKPIEHAEQVLKDIQGF